MFKINNKKKPQLFTVWTEAVQGVELQCAQFLRQQTGLYFHSIYSKYIASCKF